MMYFINTATPDYDATANYMLNLGVTQPSVRRNVLEGDPYAHKLMNIMLRQAYALGWTKNIDLDKYNIKPGSNQQWNRLPKPLKQLTIEELVTLIRMQVKNYLGRPGVAPTAYCYDEDGKEVEIPMIIDWKDGKLHWKPPLLYTQTKESSAGLKGGISKYYDKKAPMRSIVIGRDGEAVQVRSRKKGVLNIPDCYDREGEHFRPYRVSDITRWFTVFPLPFIPAEWGVQAKKGNQSKQLLVRFFGDGVIADIDSPDFLIPGGASVVSPESTFDVTSRINSIYSTPTGEKIEELALQYPPDSDDPFQWQDLALERFIDNNFCGMVEACTGAGKTIFCAKAIKAAIKAEEEFLGDKPAISIVVPTTALLDQWYQFLVNDAFGLKNEIDSGVVDGVALHGGGHGGELRQVNIFVQNTAAEVLPYIRSESFEMEGEESDYELSKYSTEQIEAFNESYPSHFLIVDEAHRTTSLIFSRIYEVVRDRILIVSATFPSDKDRYSILENAVSSTLGLTGEDNYSQPRMLCVYRYPHALKKGNISPFNLHIVRFSLSEQERVIYDQITSYIKDVAKKTNYEQGKSEAETLQLIQNIERGSDAWEMIRESEGLQRELGVTVRGRDDRAQMVQRDSHSVFLMKVLGGARARLSWGSGNRLACALDIIQENLKNDKTIIVFHKSVDGAAALYKLLYDYTYWGSGPGGKDLIGIYHSQQPPEFNAKYLQAFKEKKIRCLISVQALLEGLDVPHCDVGICVAADQSDIKLVQSLGRVLRVSPGTPKKDYFFLSANTSKDQVVEAKFENTLKDTEGEWIIDPPTEVIPNLEPNIGATLKEEAGLPSTPELEEFIIRLMSNQESENFPTDDVDPGSEEDATDDADSGSEEDTTQGTDELRKKVEIVHPPWIKFIQPERGRPKKLGPKPRY